MRAKGLNLGQAKKILIFLTLVVFFLVCSFYGLIHAKPFLAPFITAFILALLMLPLARKTEKLGVNRSLSSFLNTFLLFLVSLGFFALFSFQIKSFAQDWPQIQKTMKPKIENLKSFISQETNLKEDDLEIKEEDVVSWATSGSTRTRAANTLFGFLQFLGIYLLTFIYIFFMLNYRRRFKIFLLYLFPKSKEHRVKKTIEKAAKIAPAYLLGKLLLMAGLTVLYSIGLGLSGVPNFLLVSAIAAFFTIIPYIGNIVGMAMAMSFGYLTSGDVSVLIGIALTFGIAQPIESYILQPYIVGDKVDVHPFLIIVSVIIGNLVWGVIGMILAIPLVAIITVILLQIPSLRNFGILFSNKSLKEYQRRK